MKRIKLSQGLYAKVDNEDYESLSAFKWFVMKKHGLRYAFRNTNKTTPLMHRQITNAPKGMAVDHIDGNGLNNCRSNLRIVTTRENLQNQKRHRAGKLPGATLLKGGKYQAQSSRNYIGVFTTEREAHEAYLESINIKPTPTTKEAE